MVLESTSMLTQIKKALGSFQATQDEGGYHNFIQDADLRVFWRLYFKGDWEVGGASRVTHLTLARATTNMCLGACATTST